jgi:pre-rRNA-processing protein TSR3
MNIPEPDSTEQPGSDLPESRANSADSDQRYPPTIIVVHPKERRSKCSVEPLRSRTDFVFVRFPDPVSLPLSNYVRLGIGGEVLSAADAQAGLLVLDGTWKLAQRMEPFYADLPVRSLPPLVTAYPRTSFVFPDPSEGLATVEAVYAALRMMGRPAHDLLDYYYWKQPFLQRNGWAE